MQEIANKAQSTWDKFRRERDFHRMHHKRVAQVHASSISIRLSTSAVDCELCYLLSANYLGWQEKEKLAGDVKRLRNHIRSYEPMIAELRRKYELAMKEKMLVWSHTS